MKNDDAPVIAGIAEKDPAVLDFSMAEAERWDAPLRLVHTYVVPPSAMGSIYGLDVPAAFRDGAEEVMEEAVSFIHARGAAPLETAVIRGPAPQTLDRISREARVIVIGPDSHKPWAVRLFEGRTARHLVQHASCPVVVVPDSWEPTSNGGTVVVLIDRVGLSDGPLRYAFNAARRRGGHVRVVQADSQYETAADLDAHREHLTRLLEGWRSWYPGVRAETTVLTGEPAQVAWASEAGAELLVVSRSLGNPHLWPTAPAARTIAQAARCPVVVVPAVFNG